MRSPSRRRAPALAGTLLPALLPVLLPVLLLLGLTACGGSPGGEGAGATPTAVSVLRTTSNALGTVVTDGAGRTLYVFDRDAKGATASACTGSCLGTWPPALQGSSAATTEGVTGTVGSIAGPAGGRQVTLDGRPLYYFSGDTEPGQARGQGVQGTWWVVDASGARVTTVPDTGSGGGYGY